MSRIAQHGRRSTGNRASGRRFARTGAAVGALAIALPLTLGPAPQALAQSSGIFINNDVLNSLGPGPAAPLAPAAPATPSAPSLLPVQPLAPQPQNRNNLTFQTYGSGDYVVTRPGTLLFPPLEAPTSTLAPGLTDNHAARAEAMSNAFAAGPEPSSQLLIPLERDSSGDSVVVFMDNLPPADPAAQAGSAPTLTLKRPALAAPAPAPRKPEVPADMLAEVGATTIDDTTVLAPEFQAATPEVTPSVPPAAATETAPAEAARVEAAPPAPAPAPTVEVAQAAPAAAPAPAEPVEPAASPMVVNEAPKPATETLAATQSVPAPTAEPETAPAAPQAAASAPVRLLPPAGSAAAEAPAVVETPLPSAEVPAPLTQTAALPQAEASDASPAVAAVGDMTFVFETDSAELSTTAQNELRSLAQAMRAREDGRIQVLGFASGEGGSDDLARRLALSRALKVRTFLIDAGVPSARIQVRSLGAQSDGGPANRVDIRPIDS